jgi:hypothetical protein
MLDAYRAVLLRGDAVMPTSQTMPLHKSDKGRGALLDRSGGMSMLERRALILCDGKRGREQLVGLLGPDILPGLERLLREGYLMDAADGRPAASKPGLSIVAPSLPADPAPAPVVATPTVVAAKAAALAAAPPAPKSRRSLAAAKMYIVDMLQLQRDAESVSLKAELQTSPSEDELVHRLGKALRHISTVASATYAQRIGERLAEILPEAHLPRLAASAGPVPGATATALGRLTLA